MVDRFKGHTEAASDPSRQWYEVTPADDTDLPVVPKGILSNDGGDVEMVGEDGVAVVFTLLAGVVYPLAPQRVKAAGTTSTSIVALV